MILMAPYGYRRVQVDPGGLGAVPGRRPELVRSLMRELGLEACQPRPWRGQPHRGRRVRSTTTIPRPWCTADFTAATAPARKWSAILVTFPRWEGWLFLGHGHRLPHPKPVIGWAMDDKLQDSGSSRGPSRWPPVITPLGERRYLHTRPIAAAITHPASSRRY